MTTGTPQPMDPRRPRGGPARRTGRSRLVYPLLPLLAVGWAVLEIWLLLLLGKATSGLTVFLVLLAGLVLGTFIINRAGRRAWRRLAASVQQPGGPPPAAPPAGRERGGNALAMAGGLLLIMPGLLTDVLGLLCVFPPTAALLRRAGKGLLVAGSGPLGTVYQEVRAADQQRRMHRPDGKVVPGEVIKDSTEDPGSGRPDRPDEPGTRPPR